MKLMGRSSGFIAMQASLASGQIDICLIPEVCSLPYIYWILCNAFLEFLSKIISYFISQVPFNLHGPHGVLRHLKYLLETKGSAVVCAAEGAGQVSSIIIMLVLHLDVTSNEFFLTEKVP